MTGAVSVGSRVELQAARRFRLRCRRRRIERAPALGVLVIGWLIVPAGARADTGVTLYVDQSNSNCSDTGAGAAAQPFCTIGAAAAKTAPGTTVMIASGTYAEAVDPPVSGTPGNPITYTAAPGAHVEVTGSSSSSYTFDVAKQSWITIKGLNLTTARDTGVVDVAGSNDEVLDNQVQCTSPPVYGVNLTHSSSQVAVTGNRTAGCGIGIHDSSTDSVVEDNTSDHDNFGIDLYTATRTRIAGNAIAALYGIQVNEADDTTIVNNRVRATAKGIDDESSSNTAILNNAILLPPGSSQ